MTKSAGRDSQAGSEVGVELGELVDYLDGYLSTSEIPDFRGARNGLQIEGPETVHRVGAAVDACLATIESAVERGIDLLLVHHGLYWGDPLPMTGRTYRKVRALVDARLAVYASHLPLDVHPEVGNNALLARGLGMEVRSRFASYEGTELALAGQWDGSRDELVDRLEEILGTRPRLFPLGPGRVERLGVLTGSGGSTVKEAAALGLDTFITGEADHPSFFDAEENGLNLVLAGHYATETLGVRALSEHLAERFGIEAVFLDHPTGL